MATKSYCDRCNREVGEGMKLITVTDRELLARPSSGFQQKDIIELCSRCESQLQDWVKRGVPRPMEESHAR